MKIDVCICTHNPRLEILTIVLNAIANQTIGKDQYQVWIIDNASSPAISAVITTPLEIAGITCHLLQEPRLGIMYARELAGQATTGDAVVFVDDDNELMSNYLEIAIDILSSCPEIGFFGGKLLADIKVEYPNWMNELFAYIGIKDCGDLPMSECLKDAYKWGEWEPPTAGAVVRRQVLQKYFEKLKSIPSSLVIGRQGSSGLLSSEDSLIAKCCYDMGLACSYQPKLQLIHHINARRLKFSYFTKLLFNYGRSYVLLERILDQEIPRLSNLQTLIFICRRVVIRIIAKRREKKSIPHTFCMIAWDLGYASEAKK